jgi:hypothetical protein
VRQRGSEAVRQRGSSYTLHFRVPRRLEHLILEGTVRHRVVAKSHTVVTTDVVLSANQRPAGLVLCTRGWQPVVTMANVGQVFTSPHTTHRDRVPNMATQCPEAH